MAGRGRSPCRARSRDSGRSTGPYSRQRFEELPLGRGTVGRLREDGDEPATQERVARRLGGELHSQRNEPRRLPRTRTGAGDSGILLEEGEQKRALGGEVAVDRALRESGSQGDFIERRDLEATLGEQLEPCRDEKGPGLCLAALVNDSHEYPGYQQGPVAQDSEAMKGLKLIPAGIVDTYWSLD